MEQERSTLDMLARRAGRNLLTGLTDMAQKVPSPHGLSLRITVEVIDSGEVVDTVGSVDVDTTNADDLGFIASQRAVTLAAKATEAVQAPSCKSHLRLVGGA